MIPLSASEIHWTRGFCDEQDKDKQDEDEDEQDEQELGIVVVGWDVDFQLLIQSIFSECLPSSLFMFSTFPSFSQIFIKFDKVFIMI